MKRLIWLLVLTSNFLFSQNNVAFFHSNDFAASANEENVAMAITSFELVGGLVVVRASVDGQEGNFVLDTGAPGVVLNTKRKEGNTVQAVGLGGGIELGEVELAAFEWGMIKKADFTGMTLDISQLEQASGRDLMGLIGYDVLQNYELLFDYRKRIIRMYDARKAEKFRPAGNTTIVPFKLNGHLPVLSVKMGGKRAYLGVDSGAEVNLLDDSFFAKLKGEHLTDMEVERVSGLDKRRQKVHSAKLDELEISDAEMENLRFLFLDLSPVQEQAEVRMDGVLGFPFFANHRISINYKKKKMYIWN